MAPIDDFVTSAGAWIAIAVIVVGALGRMLEKRLHKQARLLEDLKVVDALTAAGPPLDRAAMLVRRSIVRSVQRHYVPTNRWLNGVAGVSWAVLTALLAAMANVFLLGESKSYAGAGASMALASASLVLSLGYFSKVGTMRFDSDKEIPSRVKDIMRELEVPSARQLRTQADVTKGSKGKHESR